MNFGTPLSRSEMKNVLGGYMKSMVCHCNNGDTTNTTACAYSTSVGYANCWKAAQDFCGGSATCVSDGL